MYPRSRSTQRSSPINGLPIELLSYIFTLGTHATQEVSETNDAHRQPPFNVESVKTPLILSAVCHHWRRVVLNSPGLWTSLCITTEMVENLDEEEMEHIPSTSTQSSIINTSHLTAYLRLSRSYPLDILIDARDQDWDFFEPEIPSEYEMNTYTPPFSNAHMNTIVSKLLPHLSRWRSLSILTDSWSPMYTALNQINSSITSSGAPILESLILMRCNDFISFSPEFQPQTMKGPSFLAFGNGILDDCSQLLPKLKHLTLRGVHVDWTSLSAILASSQRGLSSLELSSHCDDVRPSLSEFQQLLQANPALEQLSISGSGPFIPEDVEDFEDLMMHDVEPVSLPVLDDITIGYRCAVEGRTILELLDAPNAKNLALEDARYPGDPEDVDAGSLLTYIGTGSFVQENAEQPYLVQWQLSGGAEVPFSIAGQSSVPKCRHGAVQESEPASRAAFPLLENVMLKNVKSCPRPLEAFFGSLPNLQRLELIGMSMQAVRALLPLKKAVSISSSLSVDSPLCSCPCPQLQSLCIRGFEHLQLPDYHFIIGGLDTEREVNGGSFIREVDIYLDAMGDMAEDVLVVPTLSPKKKVKIFREMSVEVDEDYIEMEAEMDAFKTGGVFNDPVFDAYYSAGTLVR
ncbi:hypothetical protein BDQ12DRAFT_686990 [Crucibulum laeve]|uniref:Uncharacterized protein n=1 Tax=Crucibulum laeve TaxID=68775 RepID=A0A5C3LTS9_9AGAR|nr:hypothetical protein BDQ12DRAFT_686990 [Crucibulum laeve]